MLLDGDTEARLYGYISCLAKKKMDLFFVVNLINVFERTGFRNLTFTPPSHMNKYSLRWKRRRVTDRESIIIPLLAPSLSQLTFLGNAHVSDIVLKDIHNSFNYLLKKLHFKDKNNELQDF